MRIYLVILFCMGFSCVRSQAVMSFKDAEAKEYMSELELRYNVPSDSTEQRYSSDLDDGQEKVMFREMRIALADSLQSWGFQWDKTRSIHSRLFISSDGQVQYFIYSASPSFSSMEDEFRFRSLVRRFCVNYRFPHLPDAAVARYAPIHFIAK